MKAKVIIKQTSRGYYVEIDNGYGNTLTLTDTLKTVEEAYSELSKFKEVIDNPIFES